MARHPVSLDGIIPLGYVFASYPGPGCIWQNRLGRNRDFLPEPAIRGIAVEATVTARPVITGWEQGTGIPAW